MFAALGLAITLTFTACGEHSLNALQDGFLEGDDSDSETDNLFCPLTDTRNGNIYKCARIGSQLWMAENLNYEASGSKCYNDDPANCTKYGRLYDWVTALDLPSSCNSSTCASRVSTKHKGICPAGWHIPNDADWNVLMKFANPSCKDNDHCPDAGTKLKAANGWTEDGGTDNFGFTALPGGSYDGSFYGIGYYGNFWSASEADGNNAYGRGMSYSYGLATYIDWLDHNKDFLRSVRCVKD